MWSRHLLSAREVQVAREGDTFDGDGLIFRVKEHSASWEKEPYKQKC
jgi:hypothetical protein